MVTVLSPALPSELLTYVIAHCVHPTTLVICASQDDFVQSVVTVDHDALQTSSLLQVAVARHIRVAFVPTVVHLRAFLAAFDPAASRVPPPPVEGKRDEEESDKNEEEKNNKLLLVYGFLQLHSASSEWSSQGLNTSAAALVEAGRRTGFATVVIDVPHDAVDPYEERVPVLSSGPRMQLQRAGLSLRTQSIRHVFRRWFRFAGTEKGEKQEQQQQQEQEQNPD